MMTTILILLAFNTFVAESTSNLCGTSTSHVLSSEIASRSCAKTFETDAEYSAEACVGGMKLKNPDLTNPTNRGICSFPNIMSSSQCSEEHPGFTYSETTCADKLQEFSYLDQKNATSKCSERSHDILQFGQTCCSDKTSICEQFLPQLCETKTTYQPSAIESRSCFQYANDETEYNALSCNGGIKAKNPTPGSLPYGYCMSPNTQSSTVCTTQHPGFIYSETTCANKLKDFAFLGDKSAASKCSTDSHDILRFGQTCCSDMTSICEQFQPQLCETKTAYQPSAIESRSCFKYANNETEYNALPCNGGGKSKNLTPGSLPYGYCVFPNTLSSTECTTRHPGFTFHENTCSSKALDFSYLGDKTAASKCSERSHDLIQFGQTCCSDKKSICEQFQPQLCREKSKFQPNAIGNRDCIKDLNDEAEYTAEACVGGIKSRNPTPGNSPYGRCDFFRVNSRSQCSSEHPGVPYSEEACSAMAARLSYSSLTDLKTKCSTNYEYVDFAENCCSDKVGICDQFTPQYCATKSNYQPTAIWNTGCLKFFSFSTQIEYNNEVCDGTKEVASEGSGICFLPNIPKTSSCPSGFVNYDVPCSARESYFGYSSSAELASKCISKRNEYSDFGQACCSDRKSVCDKPPPSPCSAGTYSRTGSAPCSKCAKGRFGAKKGAKSCSKCPKGRYTFKSGALKVSACRKYYVKKTKKYM